MDTNNKNLVHLRNTREMYQNNIVELDTIVRYKLNNSNERIFTDEYIDKKIETLKEALSPILVELSKIEQQVGEITSTPNNNYNFESDTHDTNLPHIVTDDKQDTIVNLPHIVTDDKQDTIVNLPHIVTDDKQDVIVNLPHIVTDNAQDTIVNYSNEGQIVENYVNINDINSDNGSTIYDIIPLPSKGQCYKHKLSKIPVSYLNAYDENLITSMNLYHDNMFIDCLLKEKIKLNNFSSDSLLKGDRDAILLWLRATGYGNEYPIIVTDPTTHTEFETIIDLNNIKTKPFDLIGDENGYFDYVLPISKHVIKFKYLTAKEDRYLEKLTNPAPKDVKMEELSKAYNSIKDLLTSDKDLNEIKRKQLNSIVDILKEWIGNVSDSKTKNLVISNKLTTKLEMNIVSINGNTDRLYIHNYIKTMKALDSLNLRKYITDNEPGLNFNVEIERPKTLGGGSFTTFLTFDQFIFLYI